MKESSRAQLCRAINATAAVIYRRSIILTKRSCADEATQVEKQILSELEGISTESEGYYSADSLEDICSPRDTTLTDKLRRCQRRSARNTQPFANAENRQSIIEMLSKSSVIFRNGALSIKELERLRDLIIDVFPPVHNFDWLNPTVSSHLFQRLLLQCKGIRPALSIRCIGQSASSTQCVNTYRKSLFRFRIVDVLTGVAWYTEKTYKSIYHLHRKMAEAYELLHHLTISKQTKYSDDACMFFEEFLRIVASVAANPEFTLIDSFLLELLQQFLDTPSPNTLQCNQSQPFARRMRIFVYHILHDSRSLVGKTSVQILKQCSALKRPNDESLQYMEIISSYLDNLQQLVIENHFDDLVQYAQVMRLCVNLQRDGGQTTSAESGQGSQYLSAHYSTRLEDCVMHAIRYEVEEFISAPNMDTLMLCARKQVQSQDTLFRQKVEHLRRKPQTYFEIPIKKTAISSWLMEIELINEMDRAFLVWDKMRKLIATMRHIHALYTWEKNFLDSRCENHSHENTVTDRRAPSDVSATEDTVLSCDDLLAILSYILVQSDLKEPVATCVLLNNLCDPEYRKSEASYYLATFEAAIHNILSKDG